MHKVTFWLPLLPDGAYVNGLWSHLDWRMRQLSSRDLWEAMFDMQDEFAFPYIDDTLVFSDTFDIT